MANNPRALLYLSLVFVLFLIWQAWQQDYGAPDTTRGGTEVEAPPLSEAPPNGVPSGEMPTSETPLSETPRSQVPQADMPPAAQAPQGSPAPGALGSVPPASPVVAHPRVRVMTDVLDVDIDTQGGDLVRAELPTYPVSTETPNIPFRLLSTEGKLHVAQSGLVHDQTPAGDQAQRAPSHHAVYQTEQAHYALRPGQDTLEVPLIWEGPDGITVIKRYTFERGQFLVKLTHEVRNQGQGIWRGGQYRQLRHGPVTDEGKQPFIYTFTGAAYYDGAFEKIGLDDMAEEPLNKEIVGGWAAMLQHYFVSVWVPKPDEHNLYYTKVVQGEVPEHLIGMRSDSVTVAPSESKRFETELFIGPKIQERLTAIAPGLELVVDYGIFTVLAKPIYWLLERIHRVIGNWGWAIVLVTLLIKLVFYKLSETSYRSMARMRKVQPRLQDLKERYGDDRQRLNQALMELYRKEKINPLGGCLPIVIQIPVFIALYWVLLESVELRQAPFMLWIDNLSSRDPYFVLPILMGITMLIQQKLNPTPLDPLQARVMMIMPIVFTVFFAFFPAGLVLYWFVNNLLSIAQQWVITRKIEGQTAKA